MTDTEQSAVSVNGHSIVLEAFVFVCENDECELEEQAYAAVRHAAANIDCPAEKMETSDTASTDSDREGVDS